MLSEFFNQSGQLINFQKSVLVFSENATSVVKSIVAGVFGISHRDSLGKYLGSPVFQGRASADTFSDLIHKAILSYRTGKQARFPKQGEQFLFSPILNHS